MRLNDKQYKVLSKLGALQLFIQGYSDEEFPGEISFEFEGHHIVNPVLEETGSYEVDPVEYYGDKFLESEFMDYI